MRRREFHNLTLSVLVWLFNYELHNLYPRGEVFTGFWLGGPKVRDHWEDLGRGGRITLRWTLERLGSMGRTGFSWLRIGSSGGFNKESGLLFDKLSDYQFFKEYPAPCSK
jgi:hypothetical protein